MDDRHRHGVRALLGVGVGGGIDAVAAAAQGHDQAGRGAVAPGDERLKIAGRLHAAAAGVGEGGQAQDRGQARPLLPVGRQVGARQVGNLRVADDDALRAAADRGQRVVGDRDGHAVGAFLGVGVGGRVHAELVAAGVDDRAGRAGGVTPVDRGRVVAGRLGPARVGERGQAGQGAQAHPLGAGGRQVGERHAGQRRVLDDDRLGVARHGRQGVMLDRHADGEGAVLGVDVGRGIDAEAVAAGGHHGAGRAGAVAPVDRGRVVADCLGPRRVGEGRQAGDGGHGRALGAQRRQVRRRQAGDLLVGDDDDLGGGGDAGEQVVPDGHADRVGALLGVGV